MLGGLLLLLICFSYLTLSADLLCTFLYLFSHDSNTHIRYLLGEDTHTTGQESQWLY